MKLCQWLLCITTSLVLSGCLGDCKMLVKSPNPYLDPAIQDTPSQSKGEDPLLKEQWSLAPLGLADVWGKHEGEGTQRITVAILSTGVDYNHEDLRANIFVNKAEAEIREAGTTSPKDGLDNEGNGYVDDVVGYDFVEGDGYPYDRTGLGTAAAGIIGAVANNGIGTRGIASPVSLIPVRYIGPNGQATIPDLVAALRYAKAVHPDLIYLHLANISFGTDAPTGAGELIRKAELTGLTDVLKELSTTPIVVGAGNTGSDVRRARPLLKAVSEFDNVLVVTSVDAKDKRPFIANTGMEVVDLAAPGEDILTTLPGNQYGKESGTYTAAASVSGALALALGKYHGKYSTAALLDILRSENSGDKLPDMAMETNSGTRLNIAKFLLQL